MIEESLLKSNFVGKDGFIWWIGQIAPPAVWRDERSEIDSDSGWAYRCKVRIIGYHTFDGSTLPDQDLPWAHVMVDPVDGSAQAGLGKKHNLVGGETAFGFFLDGDDAQQPVVVGLIYRNKNTPNLITPELIAQEKSSQFRPFTGHQGNMSIKMTQQRATKEGTQSNPAPVSSPPAIIGAQLPADGPSPVPSEIPAKGSSADQIFEEDSALNSALKEGLSVTISRENGCSNNSIGKITQVLQDFVAFVNGLQKYASTYIDPVLNKIVDITSQIKSTATKIAGLLKGILNIMRSTVMGLVSKLFREFIALILPEPQVPPVGEATKNIQNLIFCLFEKLLDYLIDFIEDMLLGLVGKAISVPPCAAEEWIAALLNKITALLDDLLGPILSGVSWLTGAIGQVSNILSQVSSLANKIISFIGCDALKCETPSEWSMNFGPSSSDGDRWSRVLDNMNVLNSFNEGIDEAVSYLSIYGFGDGYFPSCANEVLNSTPPLGIRSNKCRPPKLSIFGGGGFGASAVPIVGSNGTIVAVKVLNGGVGFTSPPSIRIKDKSNHGKGARFQSVIKNGSITSIYVVKPGSGYCPDDYSSVGSPPYYVVYADKYSVKEGQVITYTVQGYNLTDRNSYNLTYQITGLSEDEIDGADLSGQITLNSEGKYNIQVRPLDDSTQDGVEILTFDLFDSQLNYVAKTIVMVNDVDLPTTITPITNPESPPGTPVPIQQIQGIQGIQGGINLQDIQGVLVGAQGLQGIQGGFIGGQGLQGIQGGFGGQSLQGIQSGLAGGQGIQGIQNIQNIQGQLQGIQGAGTSFQLIPGAPGQIQGVQGILYGINPPIGITTTGIGTNVITGIGLTLPSFESIEVIVGEIVVSSPGVGYTSKDKIVVGGISTYIPILTENGSIIGAYPDPEYPTAINDSFSSFPTLTINTSKGEGAVLFPLTALKTKYKVTPVIINQSGILNVIDCI